MRSSLRIMCIVLAGWIASQTHAAPSTAPESDGLAHYRVQPQWEKAIEKFETAAATRPAPVDCTVFIGSSAFARWTTLEKEFVAWNAVNRAFGGSRTDDVLYYAKRILQPLQPKRIVYYCGSNDLAAGRPPALVVENFKQFVAVAQKEKPDVRIYFIAANVTPKRVPFTEAFHEANAQIAAWAKETPNVCFVDATPGLLDESGEPIGKLFLKDGVHFNDAGNAIWKVNIEKGIQEREALRE